MGDEGVWEGIMRTEFERARDEYQDQLDKEAARLIRENGLAPWDAIVVAKRNIQRRRQTVKRYFPGSSDQCTWEDRS